MTINCVDSNPANMESTHVTPRDPLYALYLYSNIQMLLEELGPESTTSQIDMVYLTILKFGKTKNISYEAMSRARSLLLETGQEVTWEKTEAGEPRLVWVLPEGVARDVTNQITTTIQTFCDSFPKQPVNREAKLQAIDSNRHSFVTVNELVYAIAYIANVQFQAVPFGMGAYVSAYRIINHGRFYCPSTSAERLVANMYFYFCMAEAKTQNIYRYLQQQMDGLPGHQKSAMGFAQTVLARLNFFAYEAYHMPTSGMYAEEAFLRATGKRVQLIGGGDRYGIANVGNVPDNSTLPFSLRPDTTKKNDAAVEQSLEYLLSITHPIHQRIKPVFNRVALMLARANVDRNYQEVMEGVDKLVKLVEESQVGLRPPQELFTALLITI